MKKTYSVLLSVFAVEFLLVCILGQNNIKLDSWIGGIIGLLIFMLPLLILLFLLSKDNAIPKNKQLLCKIVFWLILISAVSGAIATLIQNFNGG